MLIGVSPDYLYFQGKPPKKVSDFHRPYFLVFTPPGLDIKNARSSLLKKLEENKSDQNPLSRIKSVGEIETYNSFWDFNKEIPVFKVFTEKSYQVPEVSDHLFFDYNLYTAEHDIPYQQRALVDLAVDKGFWLFNTNGFVKKLRVLVYDIETTEFSEGKEDIPIDMIGFSDFEVKINSKASLSSEDFSFDIVDIPSTWEDIEVEQVVSHNVDEEIDNLYVFCKKLHSFDIISGHNIIGFDNYLIYNRVKWLLKNYLKVLSPEKIKVFQSFISRFSRPDKTFHFGVHSEAVQFYPCSFDTYHGVRKFYSFLDDFSLKSVAPFLGVEVKNRIILTPSQIKIDDRTLKYNKQDVQEQLGVTLNLIQQALPLCFTTCMPFDMLLTSGAVSMWDHMSLIRSKLQKKIMPPTCRVLSISQTLTKYFKGCSSKEDIVKKAKSRREQLSKDFIRVLKYGEEMPPWVEDPYIIFNEQAKDSDDVLNYHMPGGMTIKPDKDANSHFIPWYYVVVADVGAMYPTILKALNIGADTVCLAKKDETPDDFIWLKKIPLDFLKKRSIWYRNVTEQDVFADKGYILGVKIDKKPGVVNCSMTGIMNMISRVKKELKQTSKTGDKKELYRLKMMYQSLKGARNAGSVDYSQRIILLKPDGTVDNIKIGEFVDNMINRYGFRVENINGVEFEVADIQDNWYAFSVNKNGKVEIKKIKQAVRHKWNNKLVKIYTKSGSAKVTPNHSIFTIKNGKIEQISAGEINENTLVAHAGRIPQIEKTQEINLIEEICEPGFYAFIEGNDLGHFNGFKKELLGDCFAIPPKKIKLVNPTSEYVYDISVEDNENFLTSDGCIILHNTHGILSAPTVSGRQFNLWGAAAITTKGQMILSDTLNYLQKKKVRVVYGDSVDSDTDIIIKENNLVKIVNIKELFSQCNSKLYKKDGHEYKTLSNIKCLSINKNGICEWKKANFIKRHPYNGNILKVRTQRGEISVTMNHSLYTISNGLKEIFCRDIKNKNVNIVHVSKYNSKGRKIKINALKPLLKFNNELNIWLNIPLNSYTKRLLKYHQPRNNSKGKNTYKKFVRMPISKAIQLYKNGIIRDRDIQNAFISSYNGVGKIPVIYEFDEDFARILGAYAAEGSIYIRKRKGMTKEGAHIFVCGHNVELLHKLKRILEDKFKKKFRITSAGIDKNGENFRIQGNSSTTYLFKFVLDCGQGCRNKKVSPYVLSASKNVQKAFIDEYAKGDGYYETKRRVNPLLGIQTKSKKLVEGLSFLGINTNYGFPSVTYRKEKSAYHLRFVQYNKYSKKFKNLTGLIPKTIMEIKPTDGYVYDISVQSNNNFVCANGLIPAHNTDGIYLGCSKSAGNIPNLAKALGLSIEKNEKDWVTKPDVVLKSIGECNNRWRKELNYSDFELEPEVHDAMIFVKHKNYLIFDNRDDEVEMITKGNNFKGSDKANIARKVLKQIMMEVLRENPRWDDEEEVRKNVKLSIMEKTNEIVSRLDLKKVDIEDLTLVQSVQPAKRYKLNQDGSMSTFGKRAAALEKLLGQPIRTRVKLKFVVTKQPLPGIKNPSKSGVKPIDYMYPVDLLEDKSQIDLDWYKKMIENYVAGAFGLSNVTVTEQKGLDAWM